MTELWFLRNTIDSGELPWAIPFMEQTVKTRKFGYDECYVDIEDQRYLIKHKSHVSNELFIPPRYNIVFFVQKHKYLLGK